jgi:hypothetical protein
MKYIYILLVFCFQMLLASHQLQAQSIFPVQATGVLIPPYSLLLSDYRMMKSQDILYTVTLNDPVETSRNVYFRITVRNNGKDIMRTNPNFQSMPTNLLQFTPKMLTGSDLAPYLDATQMVGMNGFSASNVLPEGFNQICLEVMDLQRRIPISRRTCAGGFFKSYEPPLISLPICGSSQDLTNGKNILFRWLPRHLGLPGAPNMVQYEFTLVQLLPGIADPNDGFTSAIQVFQTTTTQTTFIYNETHPQLLKDKNYAWRVRVKDVMGGSTNFINNGYSLVCWFRKGPPPAANLNIPTGCSPSVVDAGPMPAGSGASSLLSSGDKVQLGYFELTINSAVSSGSSYSGAGAVHIPFLKAYIKVKFEGLKINDLKRVTSVSKAQTEWDVPYNFTDSDLTVNQIGNVLDDAFLTQMDNFRQSGTGQVREVSKRNESDQTAIGMPIFLDRKDAQGNDLPAVVILDMKFDGRTGRMVSYLPQKVTGNNDWIIFAGVSTKLTPNGISKNDPLALQKTFESTQADGSILRFFGGNSNAGFTIANLTCKGLKELEVKGEYVFSRTTILPADGSPNNVKTPLKGKITRFDDFVLSTGVVPLFLLPNVADYVFEMKDGKFDFSVSKNDPSVVFPISYTDDKTNKWKGFSFKKVAVKLPKSFDFTEQNVQPILNNGNIIITDKGIHGTLFKQYIIDYNQGKIKDWKFGISELSMTFGDNKLINSFIKGKTKVPIIDEPFNFSGKLKENNGTYDIVINPPEATRTMSLWNATLDHNQYMFLKAVARTTGNQKEYVPFADIQGMLSLKMNKSTFKSYLTGDKDAKLSRIKRALNITDDPALDIKKLGLKGLIVDPSAPGKKQYKLTGHDLANIDINMGQGIISLSSVEVIYEPITTDGHNEIGLKIRINNTSSNLNALMVGVDNVIDLTLWARKDASGNYVMNRIDSESKFIDCDCL